MVVGRFVLFVVSCSLCVIVCGCLFIVSCFLFLLRCLLSVVACCVVRVLMVVGYLVLGWVVVVTCWDRGCLLLLGCVYVLCVGVYVLFVVC